MKRSSNVWRIPQLRRQTGSLAASAVSSRQTFVQKLADQPTAREIAKIRIAQIDASKPGVSPFLIDSFKRRHDYLRISLTERCNLRCFYCMPSEGVDLSPKEHILTGDEIIRLATLFVKHGVTKIRLTGGEPTVRKDLVEIVARLNGLRKYGLQSIGITTNGIVLHRRLSQLVENGLTHVNISLDTLDPFKFEIMTRRPGHDAVLRSLEAALASPGLRSVKLNVVVVKGLNDSEVLDFVDMTRSQRLSVRFIEFMPFTGNKWDKAKMVPSSELLSSIMPKYPGVQRAPDEVNDTARNYVVPGHIGSIGFISSMSDHFCGSCNRLRLTADGQIKVCLFDAKEISLRDIMREGASDSDLMETIGRAVLGKQEKHAGMEDIDVVKNRPMILIGGTRGVGGRRFTYTHLLQGAPGLIPLSQQHSTRQLNRRLIHSHRSFNTASTIGHHPRLSHVDEQGRPKMVNVSSKESTQRTATATGRIQIPRIAYELVTSAPTSTPSTRGPSPADQSPGAEEAHSQTSAEEKAKTKARGKGDVLTVAQLAAIMGCKRTSDLIPLCHPLQLSHISVELAPMIHRSEDGGSKDAHLTSMSSNDPMAETPSMPRGENETYSIVCSATVSCEGKTGVEMEALTAVSVGLLTVWDMLKAVAGKEMLITDIHVQSKSGGKSGDFLREVS